MTKFDKNQFGMGFGSERWVTYGPERKFVGRFKYSNAAASAKHFVKFLTANFTVEEYFEMLENKKPNSPANRNWSPGEILETKGYVHYNIEKMIKQNGFTKYSELQAWNRACAEVSAQVRAKATEEGRPPNSWEYQFPPASEFIGA